MAIIRKSEILRRYDAAQTILLDEATERPWAANTLQKSFESFSSSERYDIFLSHAYSDCSDHTEIGHLVRGCTLGSRRIERPQIRQMRLSIPAI